MQQSLLLSNLNLVFVLHGGNTVIEGIGKNTSPPLFQPRRTLSQNALLTGSLTLCECALHQHPHPVTKAAEPDAGCVSRQPPAGLRVPTCRSSGAAPSLPASVAFAFVWVRVSRPPLCVCFSGMEDSYTVTCGLPLPCLAADAQRNGSGSHCAGEWKTRQIGIYLSATASQNVSRGCRGWRFGWCFTPSPPPPDPSVPPMHTLIKRGDALLRLRRF